MDEGTPLDAGDLRRWVASLFSKEGSDVPCDGCTACCEASQFVHVGPDEHDTLQHIPRELLFPAPGYPTGYLVMGFDERGRCPMLRDDGCSIYEHRPRTCRTYDCRVFAATGVVPSGPGQDAIARRAARWRFAVRDERDRDRLDAMHEAAAAAESDLPPIARALAAIERTTTGESS
jgi:hypothetical protein